MLTGSTDNNRLGMTSIGAMRLAESAHGNSIRKPGTERRDRQANVAIISIRWSLSGPSPLLYQAYTPTRPSSKLGDHCSGLADGLSFQPHRSSTSFHTATSLTCPKPSLSNKRRDEALSAPIRAMNWEGRTLSGLLTTYVRLRGELQRLSCN